MTDVPADGPRKPREGSPCNGCGICCVAEACPIAIDLLGADKAKSCPALEWDGGRAWCGMIRNPAVHLERAVGAPPPPGLAQQIGRACADLLVHGRCDSGQSLLSILFGLPDRDVGLNATEWLARNPRP